MTRYGDYETSEAHHHGARVAVWRAHRVGADDREEFAVKICQTSEWNDAASEAAIFDGFIGSAEAQGQVASRRSRHWVPVLETGRSPEHAYWVAPFYPRSIERVIEGRMQLGPADLHWVASSIVRGLADLEIELKRPHGNIKPANLFIDGTGRLRGAPILLSDPKPSAELQLPADRVADYHALGRILVQLIRRHGADSKATIGWPIESGDEWKRIGRTGEGWREFCNQLLNPNLAPATLSFDELERLLAPLSKSGLSPWVYVTVVGIPVCALVGGAVYLRVAAYDSIPTPLKNLAERFGNTPPDTVIVPAEWAKLCQAYYDWVGQVMSIIENPARSAGLLRNSYLNEQIFAPLLELKGRYGALDPRHFSEFEIKGDLRSLASQPPDVARKGIVVRRTIEIWGAITQATEAFSKWPERAHLSQLADKYDSLGWKTVAAELRSSAKGAGEGTIDMSAATEILRLAPSASRTEALWAELESKHKALGSNADPVLRGLLDYQRKRVAGAESAQALVRLLTEIGQEFDRLTALARDPARMDYERFRKESSFVNFTGSVTADVIAQWEREVGDYVLISGADDPRRTVDWNELQHRLDDDLTSLLEEVRAAPEHSAAGAGYRKEVESDRQRLGALQASRIIRKDLATAARDVAGLQEEYSRLGNAIRTTLFQIRPDAAAWLAKAQKVRVGGADSPLQREWEKRRSQLIGGADASSLGRNIVEFRLLIERYKQMETYFTALAGEHGLGSLAPFQVSGLSEGLARPLTAAADLAATAVANELVSLIPSNDAQLRTSAESLLADDRWTQARNRYASSLTDLAEMGRDYSKLDVRLGVDLSSEIDPAAIISRWRNQPVFALVESAPAFQQIGREVAELMRLREETSMEVLITAVHAPRLALALAAWRRLGQNLGWPVATNATRMLELKESLANRLPREVHDAARRAALIGEINAAAVQWWRTTFRATVDSAAIGQLMAGREKFGVADDALPAREQFKVELYRLKSVEWRSLPVGELVRRRDAAVSRLRALLGSGGEVETLRWLSTIEALVFTEPVGAAADLRRLGPGAMGWTGELSDDGRSVTYRWRAQTREHQLIFRLVDSEKNIPFLLCTTEMSVGLMMDLMRRPAVAARLLPWLKAAAGEDEDQRLGPQIWRLDRGRGVRLNERWTGIPQPTWPKQFYPTDLPPPGNPTGDHPLQYIPPAAAQYLAQEVLGCRLLSTEEWQDVAVAFHDTIAAANLRDATWLKERDYLLSAGVTVGSPVEGDVFWPRSAGTLKTGYEAQPSTLGRLDNFVWFDEVGSQSRDGNFHNLFGNVAEYLYDESTSRFYVAGGSALSPPELNPVTPYPVETATAIGGFSDVGFRLAFTAPSSMAARTRLQLLFRQRPYQAL